MSTITLNKLLNKVPTKRLGGVHGASEIKMHPFFEGLNWSDLAAKKVPAPFKPNICNELDTNNFAEEFTKQDATDSPAVVPTSHNAQNLFRGYSYVAPSIIYSNNILNEEQGASTKNFQSESVETTTESNGCNVNSWLKNSAFNQIYEIDFTKNLGEGSFSVCK